MAASPTTLYCSFCGKSQHEVTKLIAGPTVFICDECAELCVDICRESRGEDVTKRAMALSTEWLDRTVELRQMIEALAGDDVVEPIRGPWVMKVTRYTLDGPLNIVVERRSRDTGDISIAFTEALNDLVSIAEGVAAERSGAERSEVKTWVVEGVEMSLSVTAKALLHECERVAEDLKLQAFTRPPEVQTREGAKQALPLDIDLLRRGIDRIMERNPEYRKAIANVLREMLNKLAYTR